MTMELYILIKGNIYCFLKENADDSIFASFVTQFCDCDCDDGDCDLDSAAF